MEQTKIKLITVTNQGKKKGGGKKGSLSLVNTANNGKRLMFSEELLTCLKIENEIQIGFLEDNILVVGAEIDSNAPKLILHKMGNKRVVYFKEIVEMIAEKQGISFENRTTYTWYEPVIEEYEDKLIALFKPEVEKDAE